MNCILLVLCSLIIFSQAKREFLKSLPNYDKVPCPDGGDCAGSNYCEAWGHSNCAFGIDDENRFGESYDEGEGRFGEERDRKRDGDEGKIWSFSLCTSDSDGDGKSNGDELGDPCCEWNYGDTPKISHDISHPGDSSSATSRPSCSNEGVPSTPTNIALNQVGSTTAIIQWTQPSSCVCYYKVIYSIGNQTNTLSNIKSSQIPITLCSLAAGQTIQVSITAVNLAGNSVASQDLTFNTLGTVNNVDTSAVCTTSSDITQAGSGNTYSYTTTFFHIIVFLVAFVLISLIGFCVNKSGKKNSLAYLLHHKALYTSPKIKLLNFFFGWFGHISILELLLLFSFLGIQVIWYYGEYLKWSEFTYLYGGKPWIRAIGGLGYLNLALVLLPVTKYSIWTLLFGISFERAITFHRWIGRWFFIVLSVHAIAMAIDFSNYPIGWTYIFAWAKVQNSTGNLPAFIAWILFSIVFVISFTAIRKRIFWIFYATHFLAIIGILGLVLHTPLGTILAAGPGLALWMIDLIIIAGDSFFFRPTTVKSMIPIESDNEKYTVIKFEKKNFKYEGGQYVFLFVPSISLLPHPFSISSAGMPGPVPNEFTCHIKVMHRNRFTAHLHERSKSTKGMPSIYVYGPFGNPSVYWTQYKYILFVGGGVGITPMFSMWQSLKNENSQKKKVILCWSFRNLALLQEFKTIIDGESPAFQHLLYFTDTHSKPEPQEIKLNFGRPDLDNLIADLVKHAAEDHENVAVCVCGPGPMVEHVDNVCRKHSSLETQIHLHKETFYL